MITVTEVDKIINNALLALGEEKIALANATGRVLKENIYADRDFPPFNRVMMDGIGIQYDAWADGQKKFEIEGLSAAGTRQISLTSSEKCLEVMTGAVMPANADTVVKYEAITLENGFAIIDEDHEITKGQHVHIQGMDRKEGDLLLDSNRIITAAEIATLATVGMKDVKVAITPKVAVIATGDELVEIEQTPEPHQIRKSNVHSMISALKAHNIPAEAFHFIDNKEAIRRGLIEILNYFDVVVLSGGVSKGKLDYVPEILDELGVEKDFHFVSQRPGKPFWFGRYKKGVVFALPGNPVSTFVGLTRYVIPFLYRSTGVEPKAVKAMLSEDFSFKPDLTYYLQVSLDYDDDGRLLATPVPGRGSGDLANLVDADAFLELPQGKNLYQKGEVFRCWLYR